jgi:hypothetical protein
MATLSRVVAGSVHAVIVVIFTIICVILALAAAVVPWRTKSCVKSIFGFRSGTDFRLRCVAQFLLSICDLLMLIPTSIMVAGFWRWFDSFTNLLSVQPALGPLHYNPNYRACICRQAILIVCDLLVLPAALLVVLTVYRVPSVLQPGVSQRRILLSAVDVILDLPFICIGLVFFLLSPHRWKSFVYMVTSVRRESDRRFCSIIMAGLFFYDIFTACAFLFTLVSPVRFYQIIMSTKDSGLHALQPNIWNGFRECATDICAVIAMLIVLASAYRVPTMVRSLKKRPDSIAAVRMVAFSAFMEICYDARCLVEWVYLCVTLGLLFRAWESMELLAGHANIWPLARSITHAHAVRLTKKILRPSSLQFLLLACFSALAVPSLQFHDRLYYVFNVKNRAALIFTDLAVAAVVYVLPALLFSAFHVNAVHSFAVLFAILLAYLLWCFLLSFRDRHLVQEDAIVLSHAAWIHICFYVIIIVQVVALLFLSFSALSMFQQSEKHFYNVVSYSLLTIPDLPGSNFWLAFGVFCPFVIASTLPYVSTSIFVWQSRSWVFFMQLYMFPLFVPLIYQFSRAMFSSLSNEGPEVATLSATSLMFFLCIIASFHNQVHPRFRVVPYSAVPSSVMMVGLFILASLSPLFAVVYNSHQSYAALVVCASLVTSAMIFLFRKGTPLLWTVYSVCFFWLVCCFVGVLVAGDISITWIASVSLIGLWLGLSFFMMYKFRFTWARRQSSRAFVESVRRRVAGLPERVFFSDFDKVRWYSAVASTRNDLFRFQFWTLFLQQSLRPQCFKKDFIVADWIGSLCSVRTSDIISPEEWDSTMEFLNLSVASLLAAVDANLRSSPSSADATKIVHAYRFPVSVYSSEDGTSEFRSRRIVSLPFKVETQPCSLLRLQHDESLSSPSVALGRSCMHARTGGFVSLWYCSSRARLFGIMKDMSLWSGTIAARDVTFASPHDVPPTRDCHVVWSCLHRRFCGHPYAIRKAQIVSVDERRLFAVMIVEFEDHQVFLGARFLFSNQGTGAWEWSVFSGQNFDDDELIIDFSCSDGTRFPSCSPSRTASGGSLSSAVAAASFDDIHQVVISLEGDSPSLRASSASSSASASASASLSSDTTCLSDACQCLLLTTTSTVFSVDLSWGRALSIDPAMKLDAPVGPWSAISHAGSTIFLYSETSLVMMVSGDRGLHFGKYFVPQVSFFVRSLQSAVCVPEERTVFWYAAGAPSILRFSAGGPAEPMNVLVSAPSLLPYESSQLATVDEQVDDESALAKRRKYRTVLMADSIRRRYAEPLLRLYQNVLPEDLFDGGQARRYFVHGTRDVCSMTKDVHSANVVFVGDADYLFVQSNRDGDANFEAFPMSFEVEEDGAAFVDENSRMMATVSISDEILLESARLGRPVITLRFRTSAPVLVRASITQGDGFYETASANVDKPVPEIALMDPCDVDLFDCLSSGSNDAEFSKQHEQSVVWKGHGRTVDCSIDLSPWVRPVPLTVAFFFENPDDLDEMSEDSLTIPARQVPLVVKAVSCEVHVHPAVASDRFSYV